MIIYVCYTDGLKIIDKDLEMTSVDMSSYSLHTMYSNGNQVSFSVNMCNMYDADFSELENGQIKFKALTNSSSSGIYQVEVVNLDVRSVKQHKYNEYDFSDENTLICAGANTAYEYTRGPFVIHDALFTNDI